MHAFQYRGNELYCEQVPVKTIADNIGTPLYLYSRATLVRHFTVFDQAFASIPHLTCYSVKANSNLSILRLLGNLGAGVDVVSGGEIYRAVLAGISPAKIVYSGVGKTREEIRYALTSGILQFNVESEQELEAISSVAKSLGIQAPVALRVNPDVDPKTHPYIATGLKKNKFGIACNAALGLYARAARDPHLRITGIACHIGSQITEITPFVDALERIVAFAAQLKSMHNITVHYLDIGGGLGITYANETPPHPEQYAAALTDLARQSGCTLILEPGRVIVGNAGILVTRVLYTKRTGEKQFIIVDAAMNDLIRPSLYHAHHELQPVVKRNAPCTVADVVGPICESGDFMAHARSIEAMSPGDLIAIMSAGAYGFSMSSNYNSRPRAAEVLVDDSSYRIIRRRETYEDLVRHEQE
ncbi:MAG: diaminopimelate decarboxylase [Desulfobacterota bacterium]|nr:diaminopimelate decarboxylase [Thermodesulfobacteriota bacterium]